MAYRSKKVLITGGAGFIGSHLAEKLLQSGEEVFVIDNLSTGSLKNIKHLRKNKKFHFIKGTVLNKKKVANLVKKVDQIYHLAAAVGVKTIIDKPLESFLLNLKGTEIVLENAAKYKVPLLITSTSEVYGKNNKLPFKEEDDRIYGSAYNSRWGYGLSKGSDEFLALAYHREKDLSVVITRLFNVIGPRQTGSYGMVVPRFIQQCLAGKPITIYGTGNQTRCFAFIDDVVLALISLMSNPKAVGKIFNLGSDKEITIKNLAKIVKRLTKSKSQITFVPYNKVYGQGFEDMAHRRPDLTKIRKLIGYKVNISLKEAIKKIIRYLNSSVN
ncbi:MAG TPA: SDR family NAD(P)-dependent oxidoreductase [Candidatus Parcubacteria bacterium]|nr:nucleoside-diphosphate sugar epimerase [Parcubacteria group bacterium]HJN62519.1 SDR family NAD(P)-dependent oxidoreductase [Candidatus Parcubacteria bacterium]|tara:strand:+ start:594 stop:1577 length:984 start_codon:yes stop_codon:yes gene_type:complete